MPPCTEKAVSEEIHWAGVMSVDDWGPMGIPEDSAFVALLIQKALTGPGSPPTQQ